MAAAFIYQQRGGALNMVKVAQNPIEKVLIEKSQTAKETIKQADQRSFTSAQNGMKGGRQFLPVQDWARDFLNSRYTKEGYSTLRRYNENWYEFTGKRWQKKTKSDVTAKITGFLQKYYNQETRISKALINDMLANLESEKNCYLESSKFIMPCFLTDGKSAESWQPMNNKVINLEEAAKAALNGKEAPASAIKDHSPELFSFSYLPYDYDSKAKCPKWNKYLEGVQPDPRNRKFLQMMAGLILVYDCSYNVAFFLYGVPGTGKSVFVKTLEMLIGKENTCSVSLSRFVERFGIADLTEKKANFVGDMPYIPEGGKMSDVEGIFKTVTSGDTLRVEEKHKPAYDAKARARLIFATNHLPSFTDRSGGVWDRLRIIKFKQVFRHTPEQVPDLEKEFEEELPGIFNWALKGLAMLRKEKTFPESVEGLKEKEELRKRTDHERNFLEEIIQESKGGFISTQKLYSEYKEWMYENGYRPKGAGNFKAEVLRCFPKVEEGRSRTAKGQQRVYKNISYNAGYNADL